MRRITLAILFLFALVPVTVQANPIGMSTSSIVDANRFLVVAEPDCITTMILISQGGVEEHAVPKFFKVDQSFLNCNAYMVAQYLAIRFTHNDTLRHVGVGYDDSTESASDINNLVNMVKNHKNGIKLWHARAFYLFFRFDKIQLF